MAGYSGTPLASKLGIKAGHRVALLGAPGRFEDALEGLADGARVSRSARGGAAVIVLFAARAADLARRFDQARRALDPAGGLWVAWPKKASGRPTDLTEGLVRAVGLGRGLVDNKVCAIDEVWSALRFVVRLSDRPGARASRSRAT